MGQGGYTSKDWNELKIKKNLDSAVIARDIYTARDMSDKYNPAMISVRESRDSVDNPVSTPIILGFDVTGSMGYLATNIAKDYLNETIMKIYQNNIVLGPQIMCMAIGDSQSDRAPLQVSQFESDIRIAEQLMDMYFEGKGGGNGGESYSLAWYFADKKISADCNEKRHEKGFIFTVGDEPCHGVLSRGEIETVFGESVGKDITAKELYEKTSKKFKIFHIDISDKEVNNRWDELLPNHTIHIEKDEVKYIPELIIVAMRIGNGENKKDVIQGYDDVDMKHVLLKALKTVGMSSELRL